MEGRAIAHGFRRAAEEVGGYLHRLPRHLLRGARDWLAFRGRSSREEFATLWVLNWVLQTYNSAFMVHLTSRFQALPEGWQERALLLASVLLFLWGSTAILSSGIRRFRDAGLPPWMGVFLVLPLTSLVALPVAFLRRSREV